MLDLQQLASVVFGDSSFSNSSSIVLEGTFSFVHSLLDMPELESIRMGKNALFCYDIMSNNESTLVMRSNAIIVK